MLLIYGLLFVTLNVSAGNDTLKYIFLGHTYEYNTDGSKVDERIKNLDIREYDGVWLGGDVCSESLMYYSTLEYIDSIFNLRSPHTHWAPGNHDTRNGNWIWLEELTGKKTYNTSHYKGITYLILNTNLTPFDCEQLDDQYRMIMNVCDTIKKSSHLIMIMHHGVWHNVPGLPWPSTYAQSNLIYYNFNCRSAESTFSKEIYPLLVEVRKRDVEVICIMGDMGSKKIDKESDDGIHFLGAGLYRSRFTDREVRERSPKDWAVIFRHVPETGWLDWEFTDFDELTGY